MRAQRADTPHSASSQHGCTLHTSLVTRRLFIPLHAIFLAAEKREDRRRHARPMSQSEASGCSCRRDTNHPTGGAVCCAMPATCVRNSVFPLHTRAENSRSGGYDAVYCSARRPWSSSNWAAPQPRTQHLARSPRHVEGKAQRAPLPSPSMTSCVRTGWTYPPTVVSRQSHATTSPRRMSAADSDAPGKATVSRPPADQLWRSPSQPPPCH